jgi:transcriptional regulator with XRE-family HTH domain
MAGAVQNMPRRLLGSELKRLRQQADVTVTDAAAAIGKDQSRLSRVEDGRGNLTADELSALMDLFGATKAERTKVLSLGVDARKREPRRRAYVDTVPGSYRRRSDIESQADHILTYERGIFPGLLQCDVYAEAVMAAGDDIWWASSFQERVDRVSFRLDRQRRVFQARPAKKFEFVVTDDALHAEFGGPKVLRRQLEHLLRLIDDRTAISFRLLAATEPSNPAPHGGFTLLRFPEPALPVGFTSVAYGASPYLEDRADTDALARGFDRIREAAFDKAESRLRLERAYQGADA